jgi:hypothetical protein
VQRFWLGLEGCYEGAYISGLVGCVAGFGFAQPARLNPATIGHSVIMVAR